MLEVNHVCVSVATCIITFEVALPVAKVVHVEWIQCWEIVIIQRVRWLEQVHEMVGIRRCSECNPFTLA